jgi:YD repeat-containing protein
MRHVPRAGLCAIIAACAIAGPPAATAAAADPLPVPPQGVYEWCDPAQSPDGCASRLQRIGQAGFRVVLNGWLFNDPSEQQMRSYAQAAAAAGVSVLWSFNGSGFQESIPTGNNLLQRYPKLATRCGCSTNQGLLAYVMGIMRGQPNTWGYYLADEPSPTTHDSLANWVSRIKALDPDRPRVIVGCGICAGGPAAHVTWMSDLDIALGTDAYPVFGGDPDPGNAYARVAENVSVVDQAARANGRKQVVALQSWRWGDSIVDSQAAQVDPAAMRYPTRDEIEAQRNAVIQNAHADLILWFTLTQVIGWEPGQSSSNWLNPPDTAQRWANLVGGAFAPVPVRAASAASAASAVSASVPGSAESARSRSNQTPRALITLRRGSRNRLGRRFIADAGRSRDPDGRILRYTWKLNGRRLAGDRSRRRILRIRRGGVQRLTLTVTDNSGARAATHRSFRVRS